jgi:lipopolysaccharide export system permease protein
MKLINKYLLKQFLLPFLYCFLTFIMVFVIIDLFDHLSDFIEAGTPVIRIVQYYGFLIPSLLVYIVPISLLLGILYCLWQMSRHNEIIAMRAGGISYTRLLMPFLSMGLLLSLVIGIGQETIAPDFAFWAAQFIRQQGRGQELSTRYCMDLPFKNEENHRIWAIRKFDLLNFNMEGVKVVQQRKDGSDAEVIHAKKAKYRDGAWWLFNVTTQERDKNNSPVGPVEEELVRKMPEWAETPQDFISEIKDPIFLCSFELKQFLKTHKKLSDAARARIKVDVHARLAMPWVCFIVALIGFPCGIHTGRKGAFFGIITALMIFFSCYLFMTFCQWLGKNQYLVPWLSAWLPNFVFGTLGFVLFYKFK